MIVMSLYPNDERVRREAMALERAGYGVDILCQRATTQKKVERFGKVTAYRLTREAAKESLGKYLLISMRFVLAAFLKMQVLSMGRRYDLVQTHNMPDYLIFAGLFQKLRGTPMVLDLHDLSVELYKSKWNGKASKLLPLVARVERASCALADHLITTSHGFRERLVRRGIPREKVTLVLNTPDPNLYEFQPGRTFHRITRDLVLLYHGTVAERFGLLSAIEAVALLQERIPGTTLHIFGKYDPTYRERLERRIRVLGLEERVTLGGWLQARQINELIRTADLGVVPYLKDEFMSLALSTKTFEYATTGLPIVASRLPSIASVFDDRALQYYEPGSPADMAEKIVELCEDPERRRSQAARAQLALESITGAVMEDRYVRLIRSLAGADGKAGADDLARSHASLENEGEAGVNVEA